MNYKKTLLIVSSLIFKIQLIHAQLTHIELGVQHESNSKISAQSVNALGRFNFVNQDNYSFSLEAQPAIGFGHQSEDENAYLYYAASGGVSYNFGLGSTFSSFYFKGFKVSAHYGVQSSSRPDLNHYVTSNAAFRFQAINMNTFTLFAGPKYFTTNQNLTFYGGINYNFGLY